MNTIDIRRSIRKYEDRKIEKGKIEKILRAAMQAPSAHNQQPWEFIVVEDKELLSTISKMHNYSAMIANAGCAIIPVANKDYIKEPDFWQQDMSAAVQNILLEVVEQGLGAVWVGVAPKENLMLYLKRIFGLPEDIIPFAIIPIGYTERQNKFKDRFDERRVHYNKW